MEIMKDPRGQKECWFVCGIQAKGLGNVMGWSYKLEEFMDSSKRPN